MSFAIRKNSIVVLAALALLPFAAVNAEVSVATGPTSIPRGDAVGPRDITVSNDLFAIAFAVDTAPPWGVARGGIVDIAIIEDNKPGYDIASLADFMPNNWSSWPTTYQRVTVEKSTPDEAIIRTERDWGNVILETTFHVRDGDGKIHITTSMTNAGDDRLDGLLSGYVAWPDGGYLFGVPGLPVLPEITQGDANADWSAMYDEHWALGLHAPFSDRVSRRGRDRYLKHDLEADETAVFEAWLQIENDGSLSHLVQAEIDLRTLDFGRLSGRVSDVDGASVDRPAIVVLKDRSPYAWVIGRTGAYELNLPVGHYEIYATARGHARGASKSVQISAGGSTRIDFDDVRPPGSVRFDVRDAVTGQALDARISIDSGYRSLIAFFGKSTFFTELDEVGQITEDLAPGSYIFKVSAGGGFTSVPILVDVLVESGQKNNVGVQIVQTAKPQERGWFSADLHHHSDVLDGFTEPEYVLRSELAAGVDIGFLSDHDSVINNAAMRVLSKSRDLPFISATELSPSWGHFNAFPLDDGKSVGIDTGTATVQQIFAEARRMGADLVEVNHPYSDYGYFESDENDLVTGGYDPGYDLVEIERHASNERNTRTLERTWGMWNEGKRVYLAGGSDVHDVWRRESGTSRTYARVDGELGVQAFIEAVKAGHSYASQGPLIYPEILFGTDVPHLAGTELLLKYSVHAVSGLRSVDLIERGIELASKSFDGSAQPIDVEFSVRPDSDTWYSVIVEDADGKRAYTNPVWVSIAK